MLRGVNRYIVEISQPDSKYFDKVQLFVKPQFTEKDEESIKQEGRRIASESEILKFSEIKENKSHKIFFCRLMYILGGIFIGAMLAFVLKMP